MKVSLDEAAKRLRDDIFVQVHEQTLRDIIQWCIDNLFKDPQPDDPAVAVIKQQTRLPGHRAREILAEIDKARGAKS